MNLQKLAVPLLYWVGLLSRRWKACAQTREFCVVVVYHRVASDRHKEAGLFGVEQGVSAEAFERQMRFLLKHFEPVPAPGVLSTGAGRSGIRFHVTFDDGYADNLTVAAPILERLGIPATVFITTEFIGTDRLFWWEQLGAMLRSTSRSLLKLGEVAPELRNCSRADEQLMLEDYEGKRRAHWLVSQALMVTPPQEVDSILGRIAEALGVGLPAVGRRSPMLSWDQVRELTRRGFEVGGHGATHRNLALLTKEAAIADLQRCRSRIEDELGTPARFLAFPYGGPPQVGSHGVEAARLCGFEAGFTTIPGVVTGDTDRWLLPRIGFTRGSASVCAYHVSQALSLVGGVGCHGGSEFQRVSISVTRGDR